MSSSFPSLLAHSPGPRYQSDLWQPHDHSCEHHTVKHADGWGRNGARGLKHKHDLLTQAHKRLLITGVTERLQRTLLLVQERIWRTIQVELEVQTETRRKKLIHKQRQWIENSFCFKDLQRPLVSICPSTITSRTEPQLGETLTRRGALTTGRGCLLGDYVSSWQGLIESDHKELENIRPGPENITPGPENITPGLEKITCR